MWGLRAMVVVLLRFPFGAGNLVGHGGGFNGNRLVRKGKPRGGGAISGGRKAARGRGVVASGVQFGGRAAHMGGTSGAIAGIGRMQMNKNLLIGVAVVALAGLGYYQFSYVPAQRAAEEAAAAAAAAQAAEEAAAAAAAEAEAAAKAEADAAAAAVAEAEAAAAAAAEQAAQALEDTAAAAGEAAGAAVEATTEAAGEAAATVADTAAGAATDVQAEAAAALDPANFDAARISALIDASQLDDLSKTTLKAAVEAAASNPALVQTAVDQVRSALGL